MSFLGIVGRILIALWALGVAASLAVWVLGFVMAAGIALAGASSAIMNPYLPLMMATLIYLLISGAIVGVIDLWDRFTNPERKGELMG